MHNDRLAISGTKLKTPLRIMPLTTAMDRNYGKTLRIFPELQDRIMRDAFDHREIPFLYQCSGFNPITPASDAGMLDNY